jgi:hypothetical protein
MILTMNQRWCIPFIVIISLNLIWIGCGKKAAPVPPRRQIPPTVRDLSYRLEKDRIELRWTIPAAKNNQSADISGCVVLRDLTSIAESGCRSCPPTFESVTDLAPEMDEGTQKMHNEMYYSESLTKGYRYIYKVKCYTKGGVSGKDSNTITFIY